MTGYYVADERFPPGSRVTVDDFSPGDWHVCRDWPEHVPEYLRGSDNVHIAGYDADGVLGEAWVQASRLHLIDETRSLIQGFARARRGAFPERY